MIYTILYVIGGLYFFRKAVGLVLADCGPRPDGEDVAFAFLGGCIAAIAWPVIAVGCIPYFLWAKFLKDNTSILHAVFPPPKPIESRMEKARRLQREAEKREQALLQKQREMQRDINRREEENGLPITDWSIR